MAMGKRKQGRQGSFWVATDHLASAAGHPFYVRLNVLLSAEGFDRFVESECESFYSDSTGRPSIPPGVYFRMLMIGYFERIDSERGICWRCGDSLSLRSFLGLSLGERVPDHSSLSRIRSRLPMEAHQSVFQWILDLLVKHGLVSGKTLGVDATTLEANAAMRSIVRRDTGETYEAFLTDLAKASGIETPTRQDLARIDRKREGKGSNDDWTHPQDPDAEIVKMKDGRTHLSHKLEHGVDLDTGAIVSVTLHGGAAGDTDTMIDTVDEAKSNLSEARENVEDSTLHATPAQEIVADKGYHSNEVLRHLKAQGHRTYVSEPDRGRRRWKGDREVQQAVYANRRRIKGKRGKELLRRRGELVERPFAHALHAGGMRRTHLRGHSNILKRILVHFAALNLALAMRIGFGAGTPKEYADRVGRALSGLYSAVVRHIRRLWRSLWRVLPAPACPNPISGRFSQNQWWITSTGLPATSSTAC
jgi:transposase